MNACFLLFIALICYGVAYRYYGGFLSRLFQIDADRKTPAHTSYDGVDYVPAKSWCVLFGHHFSSICGAGPIVGPVLACAFWGWGVSVLWIIGGAILMGAVADFSSLVLSLRADGRTIAQIAGFEISKQARLYVSFFLWISLLLVISVFAIFAAKTFIQEPKVVVPSVGLIPVAVLSGWLMYQKRYPETRVTILGLCLLGGLLWMGVKIPVSLPAWGAVSVETTWIILLLIYCFIASVVPVNILLQPRDYLASFILLGMVGLSVVTILIVRPVIEGPAFTAFLPSQWETAGPLWPMLFVTLACGAISGFHALISSGTTSKQLGTEAHALRISFGGMLVESFVAVLVVIVVTAGLTRQELMTSLKDGGPVAAFGRGYGNLTGSFLGAYGSVFSVLAVNTFILTTLDSATRIARYITSELFGVRNKYFTTLIVVLLSGFLALTGQWNRLWPAFGAANQLIAVIALFVAACWLLARGRNFYVTLIPAFFMLLTTVGAFVYQGIRAITRKPSPDWVIFGISILLIGCAFAVLVETLGRFARGTSQKGEIANG